ncbi:hypothetical protein C8J57DRAFT_1725083 [Mycena rebaudengoi]|nr:hypothetical protein C8J57DRAFT_1725083 [Mycena rebaudengoi]
MAKIFARSILLLSVVTTALSLFQHGIVSRDQHEIVGALANIAPAITDAADALKAFNPGSGLPELMEVDSCLFAIRRSMLVANLLTRRASSISPAVEQACLVSMEEAKGPIATILKHFSDKAPLMNKIIPGSVTEGCSSLEYLSRQFTMLASEVERFNLGNREKLEASRDDIHNMLSKPFDSTLKARQISLDTDPSLLLEAQHDFIRRLLGLNSRSMLAVLFTETGLMPLRILRILLALERLQYMVGTNPSRVAHSALLDSISLLREGKSGWASDLVIMLRRLPTAIEVTPDELLCADSVKSLINQVTKVADSDLQYDIDNLCKTHLLRNRVESSEDKSLTLVTRRLRHYLTVVYRRSHSSASQGNYRPGQDTAQSSPVQVLPHLVLLRSQFLALLASCDPDISAQHAAITNYAFLLKLVGSRKAVKLIAKYAYEVWALFDETPRYFPVAFRNSG